MNALRSTARAALIGLVLAAAPGCGDDSPTAGAAQSSSDATTPSPQGAGAAGAAPSEKAPAEASRFAPGGPITDADLGKYHVSMSCAIEGEDVGTMTFQMWTDEAPITTRNFMRLCDEGFYDGIAFHRILREFMIQGGDPTGTGGGNSPHGTIQAEFSDAPEREHGYGVLSMARLGHDVDSASCQFFLCCAETPNVWSLDGGYTSFGRLTSGVATLEALADVPVRAKGREVSEPTQKAVITKAEVHEGPAPSGETIERPMPEFDLEGEPERIVVQHVLISFEGCGIDGVTRTKEEAEALANQILEQARGGTDMDALVLEQSDDIVMEGDPTPGYYGVLNRGIRDIANEKQGFIIQRDLRAAAESMQNEVRAGSLSQEEFRTRIQAMQTEAQKKLMEGSLIPRTETIPALGDVGFTLEVGAIGFATHDAQASPIGYHIIKRVE